MVERRESWEREGGGRKQRDKKKKGGGRIMMRTVRDRHVEIEIKKEAGRQAGRQAQSDQQKDGDRESAHLAVVQSGNVDQDLQSKGDDRRVCVNHQHRGDHTGCLP